MNTTSILGKPVVVAAIVGFALGLIVSTTIASSRTNQSIRSVRFVTILQIYRVVFFTDG